MRRKSREGFTLIELLVTVAIIAIVASIAILSYLSAITRARQKRTMSDMRTIAQAWEARASDRQTYVLAGVGFSFPATTYDFTTVQGALSPTYIRVLPAYDGWNRAFEYGVDGASNVYAIRSAGRDGAFDTEITAGITTNPDCDIVYSGGAFVAYPSTQQSQ